MFKELNIMKVFFEEPKREFSVREAARVLKISPATASKELFELQEKGLLKLRDERLAKLYSANLDNENYLDLKKYYTVRKIKESGLIDSLNKFYLNSTIVLFGSASKGIDTETSDIDIVILSEKSENFPEIEHFEKIFRRKLKIIVSKDLANFGNNGIVKSVLNGKVLQGEINFDLENGGNIK